MALDVRFAIFKTVIDPRMRLFCFPYAGGGGSLFRDWSEGLQADIEVVAVIPPGRERRFGEGAHHHLPPIIADLLPALLTKLDRPYALFGHCVGALIAFELARELRRQKAPEPALLLASGRAAPQLPNLIEPLSHLSGAPLADGLRRIGGMPAAFADYPEDLQAELLQAYEGLLRADFAVTENYKYTDDPPLSFPIEAYSGRDDATVDTSGLPAWRDQTAGAFGMRLFEGGHFFVNDQRAAVLAAVSQRLEAIEELSG
jgi:medium-chain acyl-[acyl-carrier-protein] hydrolase